MAWESNGRRDALYLRITWCGSIIGDNMKNIGQIRQFILIGAAIGIFMPFFISVCLFGTTLQTFVAGAQPTPGYWSGAPTAAPTRAPSQVQVWTGNTFSAAGGAFLVVWSVLGAFAGEALALRRWREELNRIPYALLGALAGSVVFIGITLCGFLK